MAKGTIREATERTKSANYYLSCPWLYAFFLQTKFLVSRAENPWQLKNGSPPPCMLPPQIKNRRFRRDENVCKRQMVPSAAAALSTPALKQKVGQG